MKVLVPSKKQARLKRNLDFAKFLKTEKKEKAAAPPSSEKLILVKRPEEDKERIWHIDKYKQLLKVQVKPDRKVFAEAGRMLYMDKNVKTEVKKARIGENIIKLLFEPYITYFKGDEKLVLPVMCLENCSLFILNRVISFWVSVLLLLQALAISTYP